MKANMKAILEFNLDEHDDKMSHLRCTKALDLALALWEIYNNLKNSLEAELDNEEDSIYKQYEVLEKVQTFINETLENNGIFIDDLIN